MRWMPICALVLGCQPAPAPARDPGDVARIAALEQRVATLEAQLVKPAPAVVAEPSEPATAAAPAPAPQPGIAPRWANPDATKTYNVPLDDSPGIGPTVAPVTIVASLQFPEPYTHRVMPTLIALRGEYRKELRIVVKQFIVHPRSSTSSIAACAAAYQDGVEAMETAIWDAANDPALQPTPVGMRQLDEPELRELARALRFDLKQYDQDFATCKSAQTRDRTVLDKLGQRGVPAFWINGRYLSGAQPIESFRKVIDEEREKWKTDKARGGKAATYYDRITKSAPTAP
ncbi:MAG: thioredoxin domain-containing protein [Polyangiales bacterium]